MTKQQIILEKLPLQVNFESIEVLKRLVNAKSALAELKGYTLNLPKSDFFTNAFFIADVREENAFDNPYLSGPKSNKALIKQYTFNNILMSSKYRHILESLLPAYTSAVTRASDDVRKSSQLTLNNLLQIQSLIYEYEDNLGVRRQSDKETKHYYQRDSKFYPPQDFNEILKLLVNLERFINDSSAGETDPLIKLAIIHYQFECINPFFIGNGSINRILIMLYLIKENLLVYPILGITKYLRLHKQEYIYFFDKITSENAWENWIIFFLDQITLSAKQALENLKELKSLVTKQIYQLQYKHPKIYDPKLINAVYTGHYTKIDNIIDDLDVSRNTAIKYLELLIDADILAKAKLGKENIYVNKGLIDFLDKSSLEFKV